MNIKNLMRATFGMTAQSVAHKQFAYLTLTERLQLTLALLKAGVPLGLIGAARRRFDTPQD